MGGAKPKYVTGYRLEEEMLEINWELNNLILGADFLPLRWSQLASLLINKELPVRRILILAHSVGHSIALLSDRGVKSEKWDAFRLYTAELRRKSLNEGVDKQEVMDLLRESEVITRELMVAIEKELNFEMGGDSVSCPEPRYLINQQKRVTCFLAADLISQFDLHKLIPEWEKNVHLGKYIRPELSIAPLGFAKHIYLLASSGHQFSSELSRRIIPYSSEVKIQGVGASYAEFAIRRSLTLWQSQTGIYIADIFDRSSRPIPFVKFMMNYLFRCYLIDHKQELENKDEQAVTQDLDRCRSISKRTNSLWKTKVGY